MVKNMELTKSNIARLEDVEPFLLPDTLEINFIGNYDLYNTFIIFKNNEIVIKEKINGLPIRVPEDVLFAGRLQISVKKYINGELAKNWNCLPLIIKEINGETYCYDEILNRLSSLEERIDNLEEKTKIYE